MSLIKLLSGRKRESVVWEYFSYEQDNDKSRCTVLNEKGELCNVRIAGKTYMSYRYQPESPKPLKIRKNAISRKQFNRKRFL
jgi:hypothetical protein